MNEREEVYSLEGRMFCLTDLYMVALKNKKNKNLFNKIQEFVEKEQEKINIRLELMK